MSWTPYVGDPNTQARGRFPIIAIADDDAVPGSRRHGMTSGQRMKVALDAGLGSHLFTPDQSWFRRLIVGGRWGDSYPVGGREEADRPVNLVRRHADGTCDVIGLEACGMFHLDLGGAGARDTRAGRPL